jgi:hypothetical protein
MNKRPLDLIAMLCIRSVPSNVVNPGYFCYETKSGFNYLSADTFINQDPFERIYKYTGNLLPLQKRKMILTTIRWHHLIQQSIKNLLSQIRSGVYASKNVFFNPSNNGFTEIDITVEDKQLTKDPKFSSLWKERRST